jgi:hypothetical protein
LIGMCTLLVFMVAACSNNADIQPSDTIAHENMNYYEDQVPPDVYN